jgi:hypothetical protein
MKEVVALRALGDEYEKTALAAEKAAQDRIKANKEAAEKAREAWLERTKTAREFLIRAELKQLSAVKRLQKQYDELAKTFEDNHKWMARVRKWFNKAMEELQEKELERQKRAWAKFHREEERWVKERIKTRAWGVPEDILLMRGAEQRAAIGKARAFTPDVANMLLQGSGVMQNQLVGNVTKGAAVGAEGGPKGMIIGAIAGVVATLMESNQEQFKESIDELLELIDKMPQRLADNATVLFERLLAELPSIIASGLRLLDFVTILKQVIVEGIVEGFRQSSKDIRSGVTSKSTWSKAADYVGSAAEAAGNFIGKQALGYVGRFKDIGSAIGSGDWAEVGKGVGRLVVADKLGTVGQIISRLFHQGGVVANPEFASNVIAIGDAAKRLRKAHAGAFMSLKPDEVPAVLQTGEGVLSRRGMQALENMNAGMAVGGGNITVHAGVITTDEVDRWIDRRVARAMRGGAQTPMAMGARTHRVPGKTFARR